MCEWRFLTKCLINVAQVSSIIFLAGYLSVVGAGDDKFERGRMEDIMDVVAKDIQKNFYDPNLKGVDWKAITEKARQRIRQADHLGDMLAAIASMPYQIHDANTYFVPPRRSAKVDYGFDAEPFRGEILVYNLKEEGPAAKGGLQLGDKIVAMEGFAVKRETFFEISRYFEFLNPTAELHLEIVRGNEPSRTIKIVAKVEQRGKGYDYNEYRKEIDAQEPIYKHQDYEGNIGYIKLRAFRLSPINTDFMIAKVKSSNGVILDLRKNGGGSGETTRALAGSFTEQPYEMAREIGRQKTEVIAIKPSYTKIRVPLFVLVDSSSASAAEIFAYDMQTRKRATIIGDISSGRVNVGQMFWERVGGAEFGTLIAVSRVVMNDGTVLDGRGVIPDVICIPTAEDLRIEKDPCLDQASELARKAAVQPREARQN